MPRPPKSNFREACEIRERHAREGVSYSELARIYSLSRSTIQSICDNKIYKDASYVRSPPLRLSCARSGRPLAPRKEGSFGAHLTKLRIASGKSVTEISAAAGISAAYLGHIERGYFRQPSVQLVSRLMAALDSSWTLPVERPATEPARERRPMTFPDRLATSLAALGLTGAEAARRLGCTPGYVNQLLSGHRAPTLDKVHAIATALGLDPSSLDPRLARGG